MTIFLEVDISDAMSELHRIDDGPPTSAVLGLETVLANQFQASQAVVHVITGSLRRSGAIDSRLGRGMWNGEISYGGPSHGSPHDPVRYAQIEKERGPGGSLWNTAQGWIPGRDVGGHENVMHDFLAPVPEFEPGYEEAILDYLRGRR
jgi:hypothetical protein